MAIFGKEGPTNGEPRRTPDTRNGSPDGALSIIAAGMRIKGNIESDGVVKIEGRVEGTVRAARQVLVGRQGEVVGDIVTAEAVLGGHVQGKVQGSERVEVQGTSTIVGDIETRAIHVIEGGKINGSVRISDNTPVHDSASETSGYSTPLSVKKVAGLSAAQRG